MHHPQGPLESFIFGSTPRAAPPQEDCKVEDGDMDVKKITCFNILLMGQGGSGKTAIIQEIVLPTLDFLFGCDATLIVCAKWSQAENISTDAHKAVTCHRAASIGLQSYRNADILPGDKSVGKQMGR